MSPDPAARPASTPSPASDVTIESLEAKGASVAVESLGPLLQDAVDDGASVGFLPPLRSDEARAYWQGVVSAVADGSRLLWVAREVDGAIVGTVQLDLEKRANGDHRAELIKLMVHTRARRRGIGRALMLAAEAEAGRRGRTTLFLDTRLGDPSERLYRSLGWQFVGSIPRYARSAGGALDANAIYYRLLDG
jgi:ribosomal protein S18 acetylase RimI-like enzyme